MSDFEESSIPRHIDPDVRGEPVATRESYKWKDGIERIPRPMDRYLPAVLEQLHDNQVIVVQAETGTGKTSRIPQAIIDSDPEENIIMTQLTRPAVTWNGRHIASEMKTPPGGKIAWRLRDESTPSFPLIPTRCQLVIDQSLVNKIIAEGQLPKGVLIIDEAHERSIQTDLLLSLVKEYLPSSPETKVVITSATIDTKKFQGFFNTPEPITAYSEYMHPIETNVVRLDKFEHHTQGAIRAMKENVLDAFAAGSLTILDKDNPDGDRQIVTEGSVLMLLPGKDDINQAMRQVQEYARRLGIEDRIEVVQCHSQITPEERQRVIAQGRRGVLRIVCATDILRSSVTVPGTVGVIDSLQVKRKTVSARGISHLAKVTVSGAEADQGKGRAGREQPGFYIPISFGNEYERITNRRSTEYWPVPAILRDSLSSVVLKVAATGLDIRTLPMLDKPEDEKIDITLQRLKWIGALDSDGKITDLGRRLNKLTIDPERGRVLFEAAERGVLPEAMIAMSVLENEGIFHSPSRDTDMMTVDAEMFRELRELPLVNAWRYTDEERIRMASELPSWAQGNLDGTYTINVRDYTFPLQDGKELAGRIIKKFASDTKSDFYAVIQACRSYRAEELRLEDLYERERPQVGRVKWVGDRLRSWCFAHCINIKSMERTISSIRELSDDLRGSEFDLSVSPSTQREFSNDDLTKSMLMGLVDGISFRDAMLASYKGSRGTGIVISNTSCANSEPLPQVALCESVQKPGKPIRGISYFAGMVAPIDLEWLEEILPDLCERGLSSDGYTYDSTTGAILGKEVFTFNKENSLPPKVVELAGEAATDGIAWMLARGLIDTEKSKYFHNSEVLQRYESLRRRSQGRVPELYMGSARFLESWYRQRLSGVTSKIELDTILAAESTRFTLSMDDLVDPALQEDIQTNFPESVLVGGVPHDVVYRLGYDGVSLTALIRLSQEELLALDEFPRLPSGLGITIQTDGYRTYNAQESDLTTIKQAIADQIRTSMWLDFTYKQKNVIEEFAVENLDVGIIPEPKVYGDDPLTGQPLYAYPAVQEYGRSYYVKYYRTQAEADEYSQAFRTSLGRRRMGAVSKPDATLELVEPPSPEVSVPISDETLSPIYVPTVADLSRQIESLIGVAKGMDRALLQTQLASLGPETTNQELWDAKVFVDGVAQRLHPKEAKNHTTVVASPLPKRPDVASTSLLAGLDISDLRKIVREDAKKDPAKRRKAIGELARRGFDGAEALERLGITDPSVLEAVKKQEYASVRAIDRFNVYHRGLGSSLINDYLGDDPLATAEFKRRLYDDISSRDKIPSESEIDEIVEKIIEDMTS